MNRKKITLDQKTLKAIEEHSKRGLTRTEIAAALGVSISTLERRANEDTSEPDAITAAILKGRSEGIYEIAGLLWQQAHKGSITAIVEYLRCLGGNFTDRKQIDITEKKLEPLIIEVSPGSEPEPREILLNGNGNGRKKRF